MRKQLEHYCSKWVFSGYRWDFGGHQCGNAGTVFEDGKWWCKRHTKAAEQARRDKTHAKYEADTKLWKE